MTTMSIEKILQNGIIETISFRGFLYRPYIWGMQLLHPLWIRHYSPLIININKLFVVIFKLKKLVT